MRKSTIIRAFMKNALLFDLIKKELDYLKINSLKKSNKNFEQTYNSFIIGTNYLILSI